METLQQLRDANEAAKLQAETAELKALAHNLETASRVVEAEWGDLVDRREYLNDSPGFGSPFSDRATSAYDRDRGQMHPFFDNEVDLANIRGIARFVSTNYETGICAIENLVSFVLGKGFVYTAVACEDQSPSEQLLKAVNKAIDEFHKANAWEGDLETELVVRSDRDGESFIWMQDDGGPICTIIEPDYITEPASFNTLNDRVECCDADWFLGVGASPMRLDKAVGYFAQWPHGAKGLIPASRMTHIKCNVDRMVKRGLSSFFPVWQTLEKAAKLNDRTIHGSTIQASIALIKESMTGTPASAIDSGRTSRADYIRQYTKPSGIGGTDYLEGHRGGQVIRSANQKIMYGPLGQSGAPTFMEVVGAAMRIVGTRWQMPEYMISGDASNANYASTLVSGGPFDRATSRRQGFYRQRFIQIHWQALDMFCKAGRFKEYGIYSLSELKSIIDINVDCEPPTVQDAAVQHQINKDLHAAKAMSSATFADRNGLDYDAEQEKIKKEPKPEVPPMIPGQDDPAIAGNPADGDKDGAFPESRLAEAAKLIWGGYPGGKPLVESEPKDGDGDGLVNDGKANEGPATAVKKKTPDNTRPDPNKIQAYAEAEAKKLGLKGVPKVAIKKATTTTRGGCEFVISESGDRATPGLDINIYDDGKLTIRQVSKIIKHELTHAKQGEDGRLFAKYDETDTLMIFWEGKPYMKAKDYSATAKAVRKGNTKAFKKYRSFPWEVEAHKAGDLSK